MQRNDKLVFGSTPQIDVILVGRYHACADAHLFFFI